MTHPSSLFVVPWNKNKGKKKKKSQSKQRVRMIIKAGKIHKRQYTFITDTLKTFCKLLQ